MSTGSPLEQHKICAEYRTKMLDWLIEVSSAYKCNGRCYHLAAHLFDDYIRATSHITLENKDVHLIGCASLFIASKYEDEKPISSKVMSTKISHQAYSVEEILRMHKLMLMQLQFEVDVVTHSDVFETMLQIAAEAFADTVLVAKVRVLGEILLMMAM